jgi:tRNA1Val (adenine37-N6)-methyltransferase
MLYPGERMDRIGFGDLRLIQKPEEFCYGVDAVILAEFASRKKADRIVDLGTGTGIIPHILAHKTRAREIYGIECQRESYERAVRNAELNELSGRIKFFHTDVANVKDWQGSIDQVTANPPYTAANSGLTNESNAKMIARHEIVGNLEDFIRCSSMLLKNRGDFDLIHRPSRLTDILTLCRKYNLEPKELQMVAPRQGEIPNLLLLHCVKGGGKELKLLNALYIYDGQGHYTEEIERIYERI